jgi:hypothetical protein
VRSVMTQLKGAVSELILGTPGKPRAATAFARSLGIGNTVAWQLFQLAAAPDVLRACSFVPGTVALRLLVRRAAKAGTPHAVVRTLETAYERFDALVATHAGNRKTFGAMVDGLVGEGRDAISIAQRRSALQLNGCIWGIQARAALWTMIYAPARDPSRLNAVSLRGYVDLRRLRADAPFVISQRRAKGEESSIIAPTSLKDGSEDVRPSLLPGFCSHPAPHVQSRCRADGLIETELLPGPVGNTAAFTYFISDASPGHLWRNPDRADCSFRDLCMCRTPVEVLVHDVLVDDTMVEVLTSGVTTYGSLARAAECPADISSWTEGDRLPVNATVIELGLGVDALHDPDIPRYPEMMGYVCDRMAIESTRLRAFRCRIEYPILLSTQVISLAIADRTKTHPDQDA